MASANSQGKRDGLSEPPPRGCATCQGDVHAPPGPLFIGCGEARHRGGVGARQDDPTEVVRHQCRHRRDRGYERRQVRIICAPTRDGFPAALLCCTDLRHIRCQSLVTDDDSRQMQASQQLTQRNRRFLSRNHSADLAHDPLTCRPCELTLSLRPRVNQRTIVRQRRAVPHEAPAVRG